LRNQGPGAGENRRTNGQPDRAADNRERQTFGEKLPNDARPIGAECRSDRQLACPYGCARQEQVCNVGATDEQHEANDAKEQQ
jgi:hypothetical protein